MLILHLFTARDRNQVRGHRQCVTFKLSALPALLMPRHAMRIIGLAHNSYANGRASAGVQKMRRQLGET